MRKIKICHVFGDFVNGGVEAVVFNYFSHMDLSKFDVHIIAHGIKVESCADRFKKMGFTIHIVTPKRKSFSRNMKDIESIFQKEKFDIVHSHLTEWACVPMFLAWKCGLKVRINHSHMAEKPQGIKNKIYYGIRLYLGKIFSTDLFACGNDAGKYLFGEKMFKNGMIKIIPNAIDLKAFKYDKIIRDKLRRENEIKEDSVVIGHVGRFFAQKNHRFLIEIFNEYHKMVPNSILLLFGEGELMDDIKNLVTSKKMEKCVKFMGVKNNINEWYQVMDVFVLPSLYEGLPVVGVEAQASGLPCFFSDTITQEIAISQYAKFISLNKKAIEWASEIVKNTSKYNRDDIKLDKRYNIDFRASMLEKFYLEKAKRIGIN